MAQKKQDNGLASSSPPSLYLKIPPKGNIYRQKKRSIKTIEELKSTPNPAASVCPSGKRTAFGAFFCTKRPSGRYYSLDLGVHLTERGIRMEGDEFRKRDFSHTAFVSY